VHALLANLPADQNLCPKRQHRKLDWILPATLLLTKTQKLYANRNACWKKTNFTLNQTTAETKKYFMLTRTLAEKGRLLLLPKLTLKRDKPILETLQSQPRRKPKPRNKANQNHRQPKRKPKTLKPISETWQRKPETMPTKKTPPNEKAAKRKSRELENLLAKKYRPKTLTWKVPSPKRKIYFYELKTAALKNEFNQRQNLWSKDVFGFALGLANGLR
jgi:hypothetical protein